MLNLFVPGIPAPQGSKRHVGRGILVESCAALKPWRQAVTYHALEGMRQKGLQAIIVGPVRVDCTFVFARPRSHYRANGELKANAPRWHTTRPDRDKLERAVLDSLTGICYRDDSQACWGTIQKIYTREGFTEPGSHIYVARLEEEK